MNNDQKVYVLARRVRPMLRPPANVEVSFSEGAYHLDFKGDVCKMRVTIAGTEVGRPCFEDELSLMSEQICLQWEKRHVQTPQSA